MLQAGIMFEQLTGGYVMAGYHEVIYTDKTKEVVDKKLEENENGGRGKCKQTNRNKENGRGNMK